MGWLSFDEGATHLQAPGFKLMRANGRTITHNAYRYRNNLVLVFAAREVIGSDQRTLDWLHDRAGAGEAFLEEQGKLLAVLDWEPESLGHFDAIPQIVVAADTGGTLRRQFASRLNVEDFGALSIYILDRYGAPFAVLTDAERDSHAVNDEILDWLRFIELQCPE